MNVKQFWEVITRDLTPNATRRAEEYAQREQDWFKRHPKIGAALAVGAVLVVAWFAWNWWTAHERQQAAQERVQRYMDEVRK